MLKLDEAQRQIIKSMLTELNLQDYAEHVEMAILGELTGAELLQLIRVMGQTCYLRGKADAAEQFNTAIKEYSYGGINENQNSEDRSS